MTELSLNQLHEVIGGRLRCDAVPPSGSATLRRVSTDSRQVRSGDVFWGLVGPNHNGANFAPEAFRRGAAGVVVQQRDVKPPSRCFCITVDDTTDALWKLARWNRNRFNGKLVAITGSVGKTTTREMIHTVLLSTLRGTASPQNFNNHFGVPLSLLGIRASDQYAVIELGASALGEIAALAIIPESTGLVPDWCAVPDATGESKLTTLAQELGMLLLPEEFMPEDFLAGRVGDVAAALQRGGVETGAGLVSLSLAGEDGKQGTLSLIWPATKPADVLEKAEAPREEPAGVAEPESKVAEAGGGAMRVMVTPGDLPPYSKSLMRVEVPVVVTLASSRRTVKDILELGPGSIITFDKSCEEMLDLYAGGHHIAVGEAVKVGDKFGLRITSFRMPDERFKTLQPAGRGIA